MTKLEILKVVKNMRQDWQRAIDGDTISIEKCSEGFCHWINKLRLLNLDVQCELKKDLCKKKYISLFEFWYRIYAKVGRQALIPRLNHLNRTIARLENELKTEQNG